MKILILLIFILLTLSCSSLPSQTVNYFGSECLQHKYWYFLKKERSEESPVYYEFIFSQDNRRYAFVEYAGEVPDQPYKVKKDTLIIGTDNLAQKFLILDCNENELILKEIDNIKDTIFLKPFDMTFWIENRNKLPAYVVSHYGTELTDVVSRAFAMRLKEGIILFDEIDSIPNNQRQYFKEIEPIYKNDHR